MKIKVVCQGNEVRVVRHVGNNGGRGGRGQITNYSKRSAARLKRLLNTIVFAAAEFVTLTYHNCVTDNDVAKRDLDNLVKRLRRRDKECGFLWVREYQKRGAIHYHILLTDCKNEEGARVVADWHDIVARGDAAHEKYGGTYSRVDSPGVAVAYICKYATKSMGEDGSGRAWGKSKLRIADKLELDLTFDQASALEQALVSDGKYTSYGVGGNVSTCKYLSSLGEDSAAVEWMFDKLRSGS